MMPWEEYQQSPGPWNDYKTPAPPAPSNAAPPQDPSIDANATPTHALRMGIPFGNQIVAGLRTLQPQVLGGDPGFDYGANLAQVNAQDAALQQQHPYAADLGQGTTAAAASLAVPEAAFGKAAQGFGLMGRTVRGGLAGAGIGAAQGAGAPGSDIRDIPQTAEGAIGGAATGSALGASFPVAGRAIGSIFSKGESDPARQALISALQDAGIKPTAGQMTGNQGLQKLEASVSDIPFGGGGAEPVRQANSAAFTKAILAKAGLPEVADASPESLNAAHEALGQQFNELGARNAIAPDPQLHADMDAAVRDYQNVTGTPAPGIGKIVDGIKSGKAGQSTTSGPQESAPSYEIGDTSVHDSHGGEMFGTKMLTDGGNAKSAADLSILGDTVQIQHITTGQGEQRKGYATALVNDLFREFPDKTIRLSNTTEDGSKFFPAAFNVSEDGVITPKAPTIAGGAYNNLRSQLGKTAQSLRFSDPAQAEAYRGVQDALDSAMERSISASNPDDLGAFQDVRRKYKNLLPIEQAAGAAGADAASGMVSPQQMRTALAAGGNRRSYARGIGDLAPLTNAGNAILTNFPQSGTAPRTMMAHALQGVGALAGGLGGSSGGMEGAGLGAMAGGIAVPALAGRAIMSSPVQSVLASALAKRLPVAPQPPSRAAMAAALAANADLQSQRNQATQQ